MLISNDSKMKGLTYQMAVTACLNVQPLPPPFPKFHLKEFNVARNVENVAFLLSQPLLPRKKGVEWVRRSVTACGCEDRNVEAGRKQKRETVCHVGILGSRNEAGKGVK